MLHVVQDCAQGAVCKGARPWAPVQHARQVIACSVRLAQAEVVHNRKAGLATAGVQPQAGAS